MSEIYDTLLNLKYFEKVEMWLCNTCNEHLKIGYFIKLWQP